MNDEIHRLSQMRLALEHIMDKMYVATEEAYGAGILGEIQKNVEKMTLKNNWKDKWDFNNWARSYDQDVMVDRGTLKIYKKYDALLDGVVNEAVKYTCREDHLLDIGVGTGNLANRFYQLGYDIIGVDQSRAMLEAAKSKNKNLKVRLGEFMKLPFESKSFKGIVSTYAFHHLQEARKVIYKELTDEQKLEIEDEYYTDISKLEQLVARYGKVVDKIQIDQLCWIVVIK